MHTAIYDAYLCLHFFDKCHFKYICFKYLYAFKEVEFANEFYPFSSLSSNGSVGFLICCKSTKWRESKKVYMDGNICESISII